MWTVKKKKKRHVCDSDFEGAYEPTTSYAVYRGNDGIVEPTINKIYGKYAFLIDKYCNDFLL